MKLRAHALSGPLLVALTLNAAATALYVDLNSTNPTPPFTNWITAATNIQDAIDAASPGDLVLVTNGLYETGGRAVYSGSTNRVAVTKRVTVESINGPDVTIIGGYQMPGTLVGSNAVRCVYLTNGAALVGFTLTNGSTLGYTAPDFQEHGGGVWCESADAIISNCVLIANYTDMDGGGAYRGTLIDSTLTRNSAGRGGGAAFSTATNCLFLSNSVSVYGGGAAVCLLDSCTLTRNVNSSFGGGGAAFGVLNRCVLTENSAYIGGGAYQATLNECMVNSNSAQSWGGGAIQCTLQRSTLKRNIAATGAGIYESSAQACVFTGNLATNAGGGAYYGTLTNCTLTGNSAAAGGGVSGSAATNCIVFHNYAASGGDNYQGATLDHCCTTPLPSTGSGNIAADPQLITPAHIGPWSPCRGAGSPTSPPGPDLDGEAWCTPPSIGADEYYAGPATGAISVAIRAAYTTVAPGYDVAFVGDIDGYAHCSRWDFDDGTIVSNRAYLSHSWSAPEDYTVVLTADNDTYSVAPSAVLTMHVIAETHYVAVSNASPASPYLSWPTAATNIQQAVDVASLPGALVLVSNGVYRIGGRIVSGFMSNRVAVTKPVVVRSLNGPAVTQIRGVYFDSPYDTSRAVRCVYLTNGAVLSGFTCTNGCTVNGGSTSGDQSGGGIWCSSTRAVVSNCIIAGSFACYNGGGVSSGTLYNCLLASNSGYYGGGAYASALSGCTVVSNSATYSGGLYGATANNCIVYYNAAANGPNWSGGGLNYCCTTPLAPGDGNITNSTLLVNVAGANFRLQSSSPCINSGNNAYAGSGVDLDGRPRITGGTVDMGAYEFQGAGASEFIGWLQQNGLATDGSADFTDSDGDGMNNWQEWVAGTAPNNSRSLLKLLPPVATPPALLLRWNSDVNHTYFIERATTLGSTPVSSLLQSDIAGQAGTTSFTGTTWDGAAFYRVGTESGGLPASLSLQAPRFVPGSVTVTWTSVTNRSYALERSTSLSAPIQFTIVAINVQGQAGTTSYMDTSARGIGPFFYRVGVK